MSDTWNGLDEVAAARAVARERFSTSKRRVLNLVEENLRSEIARLRGRRAHVQLGVAIDASRAVVEAAFRQARKQYQPRAFEPYGAEAVALAEEILGTLTEAREVMLAHAERDDPTLRFQTRQTVQATGGWQRVRAWFSR